MKLMYNGEEVFGGSGESESPTGVTSFNGRDGIVVPKEGDYTADMVGAATMEEVNTAIQDSIDGVTPMEVYSTEETRIGTWIDGKPVYRRTVIGYLPSYEPSVLTDLYTFVDVKEIIDLRFSVRGSDSAGNWLYGIPVSGKADYKLIHGYPENYAILFYSMRIDGQFLFALGQSGWSGSNSGKHYSITLEYTKTTDSATNSITSVESVNANAVLQSTPVTGAVAELSSE